MVVAALFDANFVIQSTQRQRLAAELFRLTSHENEDQHQLHPNLVQEPSIVILCH